MKKHFYLIFTIFLLSVVSFGTASAEEQYTEDYFVLKSQKFELSEEGIMNYYFADGFYLEVDGARVSSRIVKDFNDKGCNGTMSLKLDGDRDTKTGNMNGTFLALAEGECLYGENDPAVPIHLTWGGTFDGFATFDLDPLDETKRIIEGKITNFIGESKFVVNDVVAPYTPKSISINFPKVVLEGYEIGVTRLDSGMRFSGMTGQVEWRADDDPDGWKLCKLGDKLPVYAHIRTQEDSSAILSFQDRSTFVLKADSEVVIATPPEKESKIKMVAGNIWVNIKKMVNEGSMAIEMNQAVAGIKGTTFVLSDDGKTSTLQVIEGEVSFTSKANGEKVDVATGSTVSASNAGLGSVETFDTAKVTADWDAIASAKTPDAAKVTTDQDVVSGSAKEAAGEDGWLKSNGLIFLIGLVGVLVIFVVVIIIRKIKPGKK